MTCLSNKQIRAAPSSDKPVEEVNTLFELYGVHFKSGTVFDLDRFGDDDLADGVRVMCQNWIVGYLAGYQHFEAVPSHLCRLSPGVKWHP